MTAFFKTILEMSATAAVVILVVLVIRLLLKKAPRKYSYALWAAAAFRLVCPVSFRSVFSIFALTDRVKLPEGGQTVTPPVTTIPPDAAVTITQPPAVVTTPPAISVTPPAVTEPVTSVVSFWDVAAAVWLIVLAGLLIYGVVSYVRLRRRMANAVLLEGNVYRSDRVCSPFILGFVRPRIYLPFGLTEEQQAYVLAHEGHHLRRLDHIVRPVAFLILAFHWFNPLVWAAYYLMGRDMEMSCDEKVLGGAENIRKAYSMTLLSFAANRRFPSPGPLAFGETGVKGRIKNVLNWKKPALWVTIIAVIVVIAVILVCAADPASTPWRWASDLSAEDVTDAQFYVPESYPKTGELSSSQRDALVRLLNETERSDFERTPLNATWDFPTDCAVTLTCGGADYVLNYGNGLMTLSCTDDSVNWQGRTHWFVENEALKDYVAGLQSRGRLTEYESITPEQEGEYRTVELIYRSPTSQYVDMGTGDFTLAADHVMHGSERLEIMSGWEEMTKAHWESMVAAFWDVRFDNSDSRRILPLSDNWCLIETDGQLWIAKQDFGDNGKAYFLSVHLLQKKMLSNITEDSIRHVIVRIGQGEKDWRRELSDGEMAELLALLKGLVKTDFVEITMEEHRPGYVSAEVRVDDLWLDYSPKGIYAQWFVHNSGGSVKEAYFWRVENAGLEEFFERLTAEDLPFAAPAGWYRSVECVFMNGLSSWIPMDGNSGYTYGIEGDTLTLVHNGSLPTLGDSTGHTYHHAAEGGWQVLTEEKWGEMTDDTLILSGSTLWETIGKYEKRYIRRYENRYFLLSLDGEVWLGRDSMHPNGQRYLWDLYRLTPADDPAITVENKLSLSADLNRSGGADLITVSYDHVNETYRLQISESYGMATLLEWEFHRMDTANGGYYLYTREGQDYLLWWAPYSQQGVWHLRYEVISFDEKGGHVVLTQGERKYDASHIGMEHLTADLDDLRSFEREVNALLANSVPLLVNQTAEGGGILIGGQGGPILWMSPADEWERERETAPQTTFAPG